MCKNWCKKENYFKHNLVLKFIKTWDWQKLRKQTVLHMFGKEYSQVFHNIGTNVKFSMCIKYWKILQTSDEK